MICDSCKNPKVETFVCDTCGLNLCEICEEDPDHEESHQEAEDWERAGCST